MGFVACDAKLIPQFFVGKTKSEQKVICQYQNKNLLGLQILFFS